MLIAIIILFIILFLIIISIYVYKEEMKTFLKNKSKMSEFLINLFINTIIFSILIFIITTFFITPILTPSPKLSIECVNDYNGKNVDYTRLTFYNKGKISGKDFNILIKGFSDEMCYGIIKYNTLSENLCNMMPLVNSLVIPKMNGEGTKILCSEVTKKKDILIGCKYIPPEDKIEFGFQDLFRPSFDVKIWAENHKVIEEKVLCRVINKYSVESSTTWKGKILGWLYEKGIIKEYHIYDDKLNTKHYFLGIQIA